MIKIFRKTAFLILVLCLTAASLVSCAAPGAFSNNKKTVMEIGGYKVTYDEYRYFYYNCMLDMGDAFDHNDEAQMKTLKEKTETALRKNYAIISLCDKYNRKLSRADKKEMNALIKQDIADFGGEDKYKQELRQRRMTGDVFRAQYELNGYLIDYLYELLVTGYDNVIPVDDKTVLKDIRENFYHYTEIFIPFNQGSSYNDNKAKAEEALAKLNAGESFDEVAEKYSQWTVDFRVGVYGTPGMKSELIEKTALSLEVGQYSDVIFTFEGHHIIKRLPLEEDYINKNYDTLLYQSAVRRCTEFIDKTAASLTIEYKEYYNEISHGLLVTRDEE